MKLFLDSANLDDIRECVASGVISGVTVNQSLLAKEPPRDFVQHIRAIYGLIPEVSKASLGKLHLSVPFIEPNTFEDLKLENFALKVPAAWNTLSTMSALVRRGITVNATCIYTPAQADMALRAGASILSVFVGRANDAKQNSGYDCIRAIRERHPKATVLAGSVRNIEMVQKVEECGADIATVSKAVLEALATEPHSTRSAEQFDEDFKTWTSQQSSQ